MILVTLLFALSALTSCTTRENGDPGGEQPAMWETQLRQAAAHQEEGRLGEAAATYILALDSMSAQGTAPLDRTMAVEGLARTRILQGDLTAAAALYGSVLTTLTDTVGLPHVPGSRLVSVLGTLADLNQSLGHTDRARDYYLRIAGLADAGWIELGPTDLALAYTLAGLARVYRADGDSAAADSLAGRAMGANLLSQGYDLFIHERYDEAEPQLRRALALQERFLGPDHSDTGLCAQLLGRIAESTERLNEAADLYRKTVLAYRDGGGPGAGDEAAALLDLSRVLESIGRIAAADSAATRAARL